MKNNFLLTLVMLVLLGSLLLNSCQTSKKSFQPAEETAPLPGGEKAWNKEVDQSMPALINPPEKISCFTQILLNEAEKEFGKELLPGRILAWSQDLGLASGCLEMYIEEGAKKILDPRLIYLLRMQVSYYVSCPFAIDVNSWEYKKYQITTEELQALQGKINIASVGSFSERELTALQYALAMSQTPVRFGGKLLDDIRHLFSQEEIVAIASLAAKVNYWARLIEAWRIKPTGYTDDPLLEVEEYNTFSND
ncbi:MAG: hypothetical protein JXJ04_01750 [Spirochaetales bacterium]|nr:hypothetical protein [Spirochaetales bacterium]